MTHHTHRREHTRLLALAIGAGVAVGAIFAAVLPQLRRYARIRRM